MDEQHTRLWSQVLQYAAEHDAEVHSLLNACEVKGFTLTDIGLYYAPSPFYGLLPWNFYNSICYRKDKRDISHPTGDVAKFERLMAPFRHVGSGAIRIHNLF